MTDFNQANSNVRARMLQNLPEGERLELAAMLLDGIESPTLHIEMMDLGNLTCRKADEMERKNG